MSRIILKISGEALKDKEQNVSSDKLEIILKTVQLLKQNHHLVAIVIGGGNFFRGREHEEMDKVVGDTIGMLGTVMNALYIKDYLNAHNINSVVSTPFSFPKLIKTYSDEELNELYTKENVIIFGGGIGKSGYSTDSGTILAKEKLKADLIIKMTNVDGVYDSDPRINPNAERYTKLTFEKVIQENLGVMDMYAIEECAKTKTKILVMNFLDYAKILDYFNGQSIGTIVEE